MSDKTVDIKCIYCNKKLDSGDAIYAVNVKLVPSEHRWRQQIEEDKMRIIFSNSKNPKGALHRYCWNNIFGLGEEETQKISLTNMNRLDTIE